MALAFTVGAVTVTRWLGLPVIAALAAAGFLAVFPEGLSEALAVLNFVAAPLWFVPVVVEWRRRRAGAPEAPRPA